MAFQKVTKVNKIGPAHSSVLGFKGTEKKDISFDFAFIKKLN